MIIVISIIITNINIIVIIIIIIISIIIIIIINARALGAVPSEKIGAWDVRLSRPEQSRGQFATCVALASYHLLPMTYYLLIKTYELPIA